jgi:hypothetical protein
MRWVPSVHEAALIPASEPTQGYLRLLTCGYKRRGTTTLFAALGHRWQSGHRRYSQYSDWIAASRRNFGVSTIEI